MSAIGAHLSDAHGLIVGEALDAQYGEGYAASFHANQWPGCLASRQHTCGLCMAPATATLAEDGNLHVRCTCGFAVVIGREVMAR